MMRAGSDIESGIEIEWKQETLDLLTFTKENLSGNLYFFGHETV